MLDSNPIRRADQMNGPKVSAGRLGPGKSGGQYARALGMLVAGAWLTCVTAPAQVLLTLEQAASRKGPDFETARQGQVVAVRGRVAARAVQLIGYSHLGIQDDFGHGLLLEGQAEDFGRVRPGDLLEVTGTISQRAGLPVLLPRNLRTVSRGLAPPARHLKWEQLASFRYLGLLATTEAPVVSIGENAGGQYLVVGLEGKTLKAFLPTTGKRQGPDFSQFAKGDWVRLTGIASQYCPTPPYNRLFQVLLADPDMVQLISKHWLIPPELFFGALGALGLAVVAWWVRGHRIRAQRRVMRILYSVSEEIIAARAPLEILKRLREVLPQVLNVSGARLYLYNRATRTLDQVVTPAEDWRSSIPVDCTSGVIPASVATAFRNRTLLAIPNTRRSPFFDSAEEPGLPRSLMFLPLMADNDLFGVLELYITDRLAEFSLDEQAISQHLANQIAISLKLREQQSIREQLFHTEKLAASGQLISGVASDLRAPLESIAGKVDGLLSEEPAPVVQRQLQSVASELRHASEIVTRLVAFTRGEPADARPLDLTALLRSLMGFREREWKARGLQVSDCLPADPVFVLGSRGQLERVFLNLLVHAEQSVAEGAEKAITITTTVLGKRVVIEVSYSSPEGVEAIERFSEAGGGAVGQGVLRGIVQSHGGDLRIVREAGAGWRFEVELPVAVAQEPLGQAAEASGNGRCRTVLLVEQDAWSQNNLLRWLSERGYRVVPVRSAEAGADLAQRVRFDLVFCSVRLPGLNWAEFFDLIRHQVGGFVALVEGMGAGALAAFEEKTGYALAKPVAESELDRVLELVAARRESPVRS